MDKFFKGKTSSLTVVRSLFCFIFYCFFSMKGFNTFPGTKHKSQQEVTGLIPKRKTLNLKFCCGVVTTALRFSCQRKTNI